MKSDRLGQRWSSELLMRQRQVDMYSCKSLVREYGREGMESVKPELELIYSNQQEVEALTAIKKRLEEKDLPMCKEASCSLTPSDNDGAGNGAVRVR